MLIGLLLAGLRSSGRAAAARCHDAPARLEAMIEAIGAKLARKGHDALTPNERRVWNCAAVISYMTAGARDAMPADAKILSWSAARDGFQEMRVPAAARFVTALVTELAYRAELDPRDRQSNNASLLRLADLKRQFAAIDEQHDLWALLRRLVEQPHR